jgi:predicted nucleotidyltransferase
MIDAMAAPADDETAATTLDAVARKHGIVLLVQFGSSVTGRVHPRSDVDLAVRLARPPDSLGALAELIHDLQRLFPDREVDVALLHRADPLLLRKITEACRLLYGSPRALHELKIHAFKRYQDHRRFLDMERRFVANALHASAR